MHIIVMQKNIFHCALEISIMEVALLEQEGYATDSLLLVCIILISSLWTSSATASTLGLKVLSCNLRCTSVSSFWISVKDTSLEKWQLTTCCCFSMDIDKSGLLFFLLMIEGARVLESKDHTWNCHQRFDDHIFSCCKFLDRMCSFACVMHVFVCVYVKMWRGFWLSVDR